MSRSASCPKSARIDLNAASLQLLAGLFGTLGADADSAKFYADRVVAWRTPASNPNPDQDKEITAYRNAGLTYDPREAPFTSVQELWLVLGLPPTLVERALPYVTIYSGLGTINVMDAAPEVIAALPGHDPGPARRGAPAAGRAAKRRPARAAIARGRAGERHAGASNAVRVRVQVGLPRGRRINAEAVILLLQDAPDPYRVLSWTDDFDG